jgi:hypothetical protein
MRYIEINVIRQVEHATASVVLAVPDSVDLSYLEDEIVQHIDDKLLDEDFENARATGMEGYFGPDLPLEDIKVRGVQFEYGSDGTIRRINNQPQKQQP